MASETETITFESHPGWTLQARFFRDVKNAEEVGNLIVAGKLPVKTSVINAKLVPDVLPLYAAGDKTLRAHKSQKGLTTRTLGSELVFNLSGSKHIREALTKFGVKSKDCTSVILAWFEKEGEMEEEGGDVSGLVKGSAGAMADLASAADIAEVRSHYNITDEELSTSSLTDCVVFRIGAKDFLEKKGGK